MRIGAAAHAGGDPATAVGVYRRAALLDPVAVAPLVAAGNTLMELRQNNEAIVAYNSALARNDKDPEALRGLARAYLMTGKPQLAGEPLSIAFKQTPDDPKLLQLIGVADDFTGQHDEAQARYRRGLELLPRDPGLSVNLALSLAVTGNYAEAVAVLAPLAAAMNASPRERQTLALIYGLQGDRSQAERMARLDLDPQSVQRNIAYYDTLHDVAGSAGAGDPVPLHRPQYWPALLKPGPIRVIGSQQLVRLSPSARRKNRIPGLRVVSREIGEDLCGCFVPEASQSGAIVVADEGVDECVSLGVIVEAVFAGIGGGAGMAVEGLAEASVEAFGHAVGLRPVGSGEFVADAAGLAELVEGVVAGAALALVPASGAEAIGELRPIVGKDGVDRVAEGLEEVFEAGGDGGAAALVDDLDMDKAGGALDRDEDIGGFAFEAGEVLQVDMDIAEGLGVEAPGFRFGRGRPLRDATAFEAAMQGRAGDLGRRQRCTTSRISSRESCSRVRNSTAISSSSMEKPVARVCGVVARSATSRRLRQRRMVVS